jgi:ribosome maturation protein SDO1
LVEPNKALELKRGMKMNMEEILAYPAIYRDAKTTDMVAEQDLQKVFGTTDVFKIAEGIIKKGELQLTTEQRRGMVEQKKNQIVTIITKRGINPQTNLPHPPQRILSVMEKSGVSIDPFADAELQIDKVLEKIKPLIPIKFQKVTLSIKVPAQYAGRSYSVLKSFGTIINEKWLDDGSLKVNLQMLAGLQTELFKKMSDLTHGDFQSETIKREDANGS